VVIEIAERFEEIPFIQKSIEGRRCIIAGSTWKEDEEILKICLGQNQRPVAKTYNCPS
jgi:hypothetical protein